MNNKFKISFLMFLTCTCLLTLPCFSQNVDKENSIDEKVKSFLESWKGKWRDMNVPEADGKELYNLIIKNKYKKALEIGTSTGHSGIWIGWALSKTGGKLITIEMNEGRYNQAVENFREAGLSEFIDVRLVDAHELVPKLKGPFDFIFMDADRDWYFSYLESLLPKLEVGGCLTTHNVLSRRSTGTKKFLDYLKSLPYMKTSILEVSSAGLSVSYKSEKK